jgi:GTP-binding protein Era
MSSENSESRFRCGFVAIVGRPNVGKSTLLNRLLGQKISITAHKPQTTRHRIIGIKNSPHSQVIYVDTPGMHNEHRHALNRYMNKAANTSLHDVDVAIMLVDGYHWQKGDDFVLQKITESGTPVILCVNKIDQLSDKNKLLPYLQDISNKHQFTGIVPLSARTGESVDALEREVDKLLPESSPYFPADQITDRSERFLASEFIREKLTRAMGDELPYSLSVEIEQFKVKNQVRHIHAVIWVEREGQKGIVIGKQGQQLKRIGELSRIEMENAFGGKVFLQLWVKVKAGWSDDERALRSLGYQDDS